MEPVKKFSSAQPRPFWWSCQWTRRAERSAFILQLFVRSYHIRFWHLIPPRITLQVFLSGRLILWFDVWNFTFRDVMFFPSWIISIPDMNLYLDQEIIIFLFGPGDVLWWSTHIARSHILAHFFVCALEVFLFEWQIVCACVCVCSPLLFKYLSFVGMTPKMPLAVGRGSRGKDSHASSCHSLHPARPACVSHTFPPDAEGCVCVWGPHVRLCPLSTYQYAYLI